MCVHASAFLQRYRHTSCRISAAAINDTDGFDYFLAHQPSPTMYSLERAIPNDTIDIGCAMSLYLTGTVARRMVMHTHTFIHPSSSSLSNPYTPYSRHHCTAVSHLHRSLWVCARAALTLLQLPRSFPPCHDGRSRDPGAAESDRKLLARKAGTMSAGWLIGTAVSPKVRGGL